MAYTRAEVRGKSTLTIRAGSYLAADLEVGLNTRDRSRVHVEAGQVILMQDSLRIGEGTEGEFDL